MVNHNLRLNILNNFSHLWESLVNNFYFAHSRTQGSILSLLGFIDTKIEQSFNDSIDRGKVLNSLFVELGFRPRLRNLNKIEDLVCLGHIKNI